MSIDHDRLFKVLIQTFFKEFMQLFFPQAYEAINFANLKFLSEEIYTDLVAGEKRRVDILAQGVLQEEAVLVIIHVEPQAYYQKEFAERMFIYSSRLYEKYRCRILPIAVFSYDQSKEEPDTFSWGFPFLAVMNFQFYIIEIRKKNWRDFLKADNPIAAALLSKMGYTKTEKVQVKKEFLRMLVRLELDPARMHLIAGFFETYLKLSDKENIELQEDIQNLETKEGESIMELLTQWEKDGMLKGLKIGKIEGKIEEAQKFINKFIHAQFGDSGANLIETVSALKQLDVLEELADHLFRASNLEEARKIVDEAYKRQQA
jgi:hypothetical protein